MLSAKRFRGLSYSFDFRGMNDGNDLFRDRIATFVKSERADVEHHGVLWAASPRLLSFVQDVAAGRFDRDDIHGLIEDARSVLKNGNLPRD